MARRRLAFAGVGLAIGAVAGFWSDQLFTQAGVGLAAGLLLSLLRLDRRSGE